MMLIKFLFLTQKAVGKILYWFHRLIMYIEKKKLGYCGKNVVVKYPTTLNEKIFLYDHVSINGGARFIMCQNEKFIMKKYSGAAQGLTVVTGKHGHKIGCWSHDLLGIDAENTHSTVIVEEDVRIGVNVTLLPGVRIGRGAQIGACSVVTKDVPPYAVAVGNPAKVIKFIFTPEEIIKHEAVLYEESKRLSLETLCCIQDGARTS